MDALRYLKLDVFYHHVFDLFPVYTSLLGFLRAQILNN